MSISLPPQKMEAMITELRFFHGKTCATIKQLQRICGILSNASKVVKGGRTFSRRMLDLLKGLPSTKKCVRLWKEFLKDLHWWGSLSTTFNGKEIIIPYNNGEGISFITDASKHGYGYIYDDPWQAGYYNSEAWPKGHEALCESHCHWQNISINLEDPSINILELIPVWLCVQTHGTEWTNQHVVCFTFIRSIFGRRQPIIII